MYSPLFEEIEKKLMKKLIPSLFWRIIRICLMLFYSFMANAISAAVLDAGGSLTCGIQPDNTIICWGGNKNGTPAPPSGTFSQVSVAGEHACGIRTDNTVACWGRKNNSGEITPPSGTFSQISVGQLHTCGIQTDNTVACWGNNEFGQATPPSGIFSQVSAGGDFTCGIRSDKTVTCWGIYKGFAQPGGKFPWIHPSGTFYQIGASYYQICGIRTNDTVACWGAKGGVHEEGEDPANMSRDGRQIPPSKGTFYQAAEGGGIWFSCWLRTDNAVLCSGAGDMPGVEAIRPPGSICTCENRPGCICESPSGLFHKITAGGYYACGIRPDNTVVCWGAENSAPIRPPRGLIVKSSEPEACLLYGVHDDGNNTQIFIINSGTSEVHVRSRLSENYKIDALDIQPLTNQPYVASSDNASKKGHLYQVRNGAQILTEFGETDFKEINGLAFHPDGMLWGWAQDAGLFQIGNGENNEPDLNAVKIILPYNREDSVVEIEVNDLTWNTAGTILYGIGRILQQEPSAHGTLDPENRLWVYNTIEDTVSTVCDNIMDSLDKIEALETLPDDTLLLGFTRNEKLIFLEIDVQTCEVMAQKEIFTPYHNIKGLARPDCNHPYVDTAPFIKE
jgi:alpha-tubulin suppressor-like RCC1 family protein